MSQAGPVKVPDYLLQRERAQRRDRIIQIAALTVAVAAVVLAGMLLDPINETRKECQLVVDSEAIGTIPPEISLMSQTGTLRALALVVSFIRVEELKQQGRFFELMQLSSWLCKLAPRFATVWQYNAWNQAYNISVCEYTPEARWLWVQNGIHLLRDEGIKYNPTCVGLYKELAFIYWHKIGDILDDQHWAYKKELAVEMEQILGARPPTLTTEEEIERFRVIAEADPDVDKLIETDAEVAAFVRRLGTVHMKPDGGLLATVARYMRPETELFGLEAGSAPEAVIEDRQALLDILYDEKSAAARDRLLAALRARELRTREKMDPEWMMSLMEKYGPVDWRTPFAHALYWASYGDMITKGQLNLNLADSMNTARFIFFALMKMFESGRFVLEPDWNKPNNSFLNMLPDPRFVDYIHQAYLEIGKEQDGMDPQFREGTSGPRYWTGHVNFLHKAIRHLYFRGDAASILKAKEYYKYLHDYNVDETTGLPKEQYNQPLAQFVWSELRDLFITSRGATMIVSTFLDRSLKELSLGNVEGSEAYVDMARMAYSMYIKDAKTDPNERRKLQPLDVIYADVVVAFMETPGNSTFQKVTVWKSIPLAARQRSYDTLLPYFVRFCEEHDPPLDVDKAFRVPPGMEEVRQRAKTQLKDTRNASEGVKDFRE